MYFQSLTGNETKYKDFFIRSKMIIFMLHFFCLFIDSFIIIIITIYYHHIKIAKFDATKVHLMFHLCLYSLLEATGHDNVRLISIRESGKNFDLKVPDRFFLYIKLLPDGFFSR